MVVEARRGIEAVGELEALLSDRSAILFKGEGFFKTDCSKIVLESL